jgi:hypothetical protein
VTPTAVLHSKPSVIYLTSSSPARYNLWAMPLYASLAICRPPLPPLPADGPPARAAAGYPPPVLHLLRHLRRVWSSDPEQLVTSRCERFGDVGCVQLCEREWENRLPAAVAAVDWRC